MASAFHDRTKGGWILSFRGPGQTGTQRTRKRAGREVATKAAADRLARQLDDASRAAEDGDPRAVDYLAQAGVISAQAALALRAEPGRRPPPMLPLPGDISLEDAALAHPAAQRERDASPAEHRRHLRELRLFVEHSGVRRLRDLSLQAVLDWVAELRRRGRAPDTRRHHLLYLRYAATMAPAWALPNPLAGHRLDRAAVREVARPRVYSEAQLAAVLRGLEPRADPRPLVAVALMACCGLRPESDLLRLRLADLDGEILHVGQIDAKTLGSVRSIPLPPTVAAWCGRLRSQPRRELTPEHTLLRSRYRAKVRLDGALDRQRLGELLRAAILGLRDDDGQPIIAPPAYLPPKHWRKTYRTLGRDVWRLPPEILEAHLGHVEDTTSGRHYSGAVPMERLRKGAEAVEAWLQREVLSTRTVHTGKGERREGLTA